MTSAIIVMVLVTMSYAQNYLSSSMAKNEFNTNKQFMLTTGLQIDDVAWMMGRTQTIPYSSTYGSSLAIRASNTKLFHGNQQRLWLETS